MTKADHVDWNNALDGKESDYMPLWEAMGRLRSKNNLSEGVRINETIINERREKLRLRWIALDLIKFSLGILAISSLVVLVTSIHPDDTGVSIGILLFGTLGLLTLQIERRIDQYGAQTYPVEAQQLPYEKDPIFERAVELFQKVDGPKIIHISRFMRKREHLDNAHFFSKLRYFLFSRRSNDRGTVMYLRSAIGVYSNLYIHRENVEKMLSAKKSAPKGGRGRPVEYLYDDAIAAVMHHPKIGKIDRTNEDKALESLKDFLAEWFKENEDESCRRPRRSQLITPAKKILAKLERKSPQKVSVIGQLSPFNWLKRTWNKLRTTEISSKI